MEFPKENIIEETLNRIKMENTNQSKSNLNLLILGAIATIIVLVLFIRSCQGSAPVVAKTIQTKEVKGKFEAVKPNQIVIHDTIKIGQKLSKNEDEVLQRQINELILENKNLQNLFNEASDSLKIAMYNKAIELKSFNQTFEDSIIKADVSGLVQGELKLLKLDYTSKSQKIEFPSEKENVFRLLAGFEYGNNATLTNSVFKANLGVQNRKGNIIRASIDNLKNVYIGYDVSVFSIKGKKK